MEPASRKGTLAFTNADANSRVNFAALVSASAARDLKIDTSAEAALTSPTPGTLMLMCPSSTLENAMSSSIAMSERAISSTSLIRRA